MTARPLFAQRVAGFSETIDASPPFILPPFAAPGRWLQDEIDALVRWLASLPRPVGIFAANDHLARIVLQACATSRPRDRRDPEIVAGWADRACVVLSSQGRIDDAHSAAQEDPPPGRSQRSRHAWQEQTARRIGTVRHPRARTAHSSGCALSSSSGFQKVVRSLTASRTFFTVSGATGAALLPHELRT